MHGIRGTSAPFGIFAHDETNGVTDFRFFVALDKIVFVQENPLLPDAQKAKTLLLIPFHDLRGQR
jgi:hypothetical protein